MAEKKPWESQKVWYAILGCAVLVALSVTGQVDLEASHVTGIVMALIAGRAYEGAAAAKP